LVFGRFKRREDYARKRWKKTRESHEEKVEETQGGRRGIVKRKRKQEGEIAE